ncbi:aminodeoxychorismate lyase [Niveispirillum lacus]|uniref:Endolytic murein transglycosylase n=1 Tax=Niveispirillum lacus TaxID=1981099 RepID=A0A255YTZ6_9PROT|nr:endolytic transglycosylase MltG [Niveispirillum lacus]OYQ32693.1 aminodeoxychorismate lyase [Niveispirillum lacus]
MSATPENQTRPRRHWLRLTAASLSVVLLAAAGAGWLGWQRYTGPGPLGADKAVVIPRGTGVQGIAQRLVDAGVVPHALDLIIASRLRGDGGKLRAGEYLFPAGISVKGALDLIISGKVIVHRVTVPEGLTSWQIVERLRAEETLSGEVTSIPADGSLLPETYQYLRDDPRTDILSRMSADMEKVLDRLWAERDPNLPLKSKQEAVILASIVERETGVAAERPRVAGVFVNRLRIGMRLQSDPTIIYALSDRRGQIDRDLTRADWKLESPYNTYIIPGLPPGPIANPGLLSLQAVLKPEAHNYLYFVADGTGGHAFAQTLAEHNRNVVKWRRVRDGG